MKITYKKAQNKNELEADSILLFRDENGDEIWSGDWLKLYYTNEDFIVANAVLEENPLRWHLKSFEFDFQTYYEDGNKHYPAIDTVYIEPEEIPTYNFEVISEVEAKKLLEEIFGKSFTEQL